MWCSWDYGRRSVEPGSTSYEQTRHEEVAQEPACIVEEELWQYQGSLPYCICPVWKCDTCVM